MDMNVKKKKLGLKEKYAHMTRGLDWETTYQPKGEGIPAGHLRRHQGSRLGQVGRPVPSDHGRLLEIPGREGAQAVRRA